MATLDLPLRTTARTSTIICRVALSGLRTFSGLAVLLGAVLFLILNDDTGGASSSPAPEPSRHQISATSTRSAVTAQLIFYLVATQVEADLAAAEDNENWATGGGGSERRVEILFARNPVEEAAVHQVILREIGAARTPSVVTIFDRRLRPY